MCLLGWSGATPALAQLRLPDQFQLFYSNDSNAAPKIDRWRTVAASGEWLWNVDPSRQFGLRLEAEIVAPVYLHAPGPTPDRPFAGLLTVMGYDYRRSGPIETGFGLGIAAIGPQTGLSDFLDAAHSVLGGVPVGAAIANGQVANDLFVEARGEIAATYAISGLYVRPFVAARTGAEKLVRAGIDLAWPDPPALQRRPVTGALHSAPLGGVQIGAGVDVAHVAQTALIPAGSAVTATPRRYRARLSLGFPVGNTRAELGLAWLSREFETQQTGQFVGTLGLTWAF